jgi:glutamate carboxypeptidase
MSQATTASDVSRLRVNLTDVLPEFLGDLERLVNIDCGSYTKTGVDQVGAWVAGVLEELGAEVSFDRNEDLGDTVVGVLEGGRQGPAVLMIGHLDTVFEPGTAAERPFRVDQGIAYGPGVTDMKSGLLAGIYALRALRATSAEGLQQWLPVGRVVFIANPDEEIGSPVSTPVIRDWAAGSDVALVLECARANGDIVSSRKGIVDVELRVSGRAAHAGVEPEKGRSATLEAAHKTVALHALNGRWPGVTVNVGVARGGTRPNVVAESAVLRVDVRAVDRRSLEEAEEQIQAIAMTSTVPDTSCEIVELGRHWPMEKHERSSRLVGLARKVAGELGFGLNDAATGGASDANTTAGMGVPTLDGLGPIGGNDHSPLEYLEVDSIVPRTALLTGLIREIGTDQEIASWRSAGGRA